VNFPYSVCWNQDSRRIEVLELGEHLNELLHGSRVYDLGTLIHELRKDGLEVVKGVGPEKRAKIGEIVHKFMEDETKTWQEKYMKGKDFMLLAAVEEKTTRKGEKVLVIPVEEYKSVGGDHLIGCRVKFNGKTYFVQSFGNDFEMNQRHFRYCYVKAD
jgi:hypothetical protein